MPRGVLSFALYSETNTLSTPSTYKVGKEVGLYVPLVFHPELLLCVLEERMFCLAAQHCAKPSVQNKQTTKH